MFKFFIDVRIYLSIPTLLLKGTHKHLLNIHELFWDVKMENIIFGKIQKQETQNGHVSYTTTMKYIVVKIVPVHNSKI